MAKKNQKSSPKTELVGTYLLKVVVYILLGTFWLRLANPVHMGGLTITAIPVGLLIALLFISHDHFAIDRKIEYPIVIMTTIVSYFLSSGIVV